MKKFIYIGIVLSVLLHGVLNAFFIETLSRTSIVLSGVSGILLSIVLGIAFYDLYKLNKKYLSE